MNYIEFIDELHFQKYFSRYRPLEAELIPFIDFFWETSFEHIWEKHPEGFSHIMLPDIGYTYFINLNTPCKIFYENQSFIVKKAVFLPRSKAVTCYCFKGSKMFGIKFLASPILLEKKIDFTEYQNFIYPLSYLMNKNVLSELREVEVFEHRIKVVSDYFKNIIITNKKDKSPVFIATNIIQYCKTNQKFDVPLQFFIENFQISKKSIERYFASTIGLTYKQAINLLRVRTAIILYKKNQQAFNCYDFGYYDNSHFLKELKKFSGEYFHQLYNSIKYNQHQ